MYLTILRPTTSNHTVAGKCSVPRLGAIALTMDIWNSVGKRTWAQYSQSFVRGRRHQTLNLAEDCCLLQFDTYDLTRRAGQVGIVRESNLASKFSEANSRRINKVLSSYLAIL